LIQLKSTYTSIGYQ